MLTDWEDEFEPDSVREGGTSEESVCERVRVADGVHVPIADDVGDVLREPGRLCDGERVPTELDDCVWDTVSVPLGVCVLLAVSAPVLLCVMLADALAIGDCVHVEESELLPVCVRVGEGVSQIRGPLIAMSKS